MRALVVEDDLFQCTLLQSMLASCAETDAAHDGEQAVALFKEALDRNEPYSLVCLDLEMPGMGGQEVLKRIRKIEADHGILMSAAVKVIITTCHDDAKNVADAIMSRCDAYLLKPIDKLMLEKNLRELNLLAAR